MESHALRASPVRMQDVCVPAVHRRRAFWPLPAGQNGREPGPRTRTHLASCLPQVTDDSNLVCHCLDSSIEIVKEVRIAKDQPDFLPDNWRSQLDGVSSNWGTTTFAHHQFLHHRRVLGDTTDVIRNKTGSTHEDIDALFGLAKSHLINQDIMTPQDLKRELRAAFSTFDLPVFILDVDAVLDYKSFYASHIDPKLSGYG